MVNLPTDFLRSFVTIVMEGSILRASALIGLTPSALSLQVKRLEEILQVPLFHRGGRQLTPTPAGEELLAYAHHILELNDRAISALSGDQFVGPVRVGLVQDFADTFLSGVLANFARTNPEARLDIRVAGTAELVSLFNADRLDIVACLGEASSDQSVISVPIWWFGDADLLHAPVLPIAVMEKPCIFRALAVDALESAGVPYRVALETSSLSALRAAVSGRIALTCRTAGFSDVLLPQVEGAALPVLRTIEHAILSKPTAHPTVRRLVDLLRASMLDLAS